MRILGRPLRDLVEPISTAWSSPASESTRAGSRIAQIVASTNSTNANRRDHSAPKADASPAMGAEMVAPTTPAREMRPLALTRVRPSGSSRGTAADG